MTSNPTKNATIDFKRVDPSNSLELQPMGSTAAKKPHTFKTPSGKTFRITSIEMRVNGTWQTIDLDKFGDLGNLVKACENIYTTMRGTEDNQKITFYFQGKEADQNFIGRIFRKLPSTLELQKLETQNSSAQTVTHSLAEYPADIQNKVQLATQGIQYPDPEKVIKLKELKKAPSATSSGPKIEEVVEETKLNPTKSLTASVNPLNIQDAGSEQNRCAARSVALILLSKNNNDFRAACEEADVTPPALTGNPVEALAQSLINQAATIIESDESFIDPMHPHSAHIVEALAAARHPVQASETPDQARKRYADLIRQEGQMLDGPFFDALDISQKSFVTLEPKNGTHIIRRMTDNISFDQPIQTHTLEDIYFVVYNGQNHYQAVVFNGQSEQLERLRRILLGDMALKLQALETAIKGITGDLAANQRNILPTIEDLLSQYPADSKSHIIAMLRTSEEARAALRSTVYSDLADAASTPSVEQPD